jgi:ABC-type transport system, involved in lipoprotein release, permease component
MKVSNGKCIRNLSAKSMKAAKSRNIIAIIAIALTTILFTTLFTIALSINHSFQQSNFRQVGGIAHGTFKYLTQEQYEELRTDPLIEQHGLRRFIGFAKGTAFNKSHVEIGYADAVYAHWMFCDPIEGRLPSEGTNEAATDLKVLELLGVEPKIGNEFTLTFDVDGTEVTETFVLCGWWAYDEAVTANHVLLPNSRVQAICDQVGLGNNIGGDGMTASWNLDLMFRSSMHIEQDILQVLANHGYQSESRHEENFVPYGVNWGYTGAQLTDSIDPTMVIFMVALLLIIMFTGYLIIYNVFQISVANDIRHYGLLKTIGTTGRQIKQMIRLQAMRLSAVGIPLGLLVGYGVGVLLVPVILSRLNGVKADAVSASPIIFIVSAVFALVTVFISCRKPGKTAAKVSPVEAMRYTDSSGSKREMRKASSGASLPKMALANLGRNRIKTTVTVISLSLAVVLLNLTVTFTNGFDMDKYLSDMVADYIVADAGQFRVRSIWNRDMALPEEIIEQINEQDGIIDGGRIYGLTTNAQVFVSEEYYRSIYGIWNDEETVNQMVANEERLPDGRLATSVQLYGMEEYALSKLTLFDGDLSKLNEPDGRYVAAVYMKDDYNNIVPDSHWAKIGDVITIRHVESFEYYDIATGEILDEAPEFAAFGARVKEYRDVEYEVAALVMVPHAISYRYYGNDEFIMNDTTFIEDTRTSDVMLYAFDTTDEVIEGTDSYLQNFTEREQPQLAYESKQTYAEEFYAFRDMFMLLGSVLSGVIGLVGVLNFLNAILTGILARRREFAMLQAVGMTGRQLKGMLIWEGLYYTLGAAVASFLICVATAPLLGSVLGSMFWFFSYQFTILPIFAVIPVFAVLGIILPLIAYRTVARYSIVERLREVS